MKVNKIFFLVALTSFFLGYKTKALFLGEKTNILPNEEIVITMESPPAAPTNLTNLPHNQAIYAAHCAACHDTGAAGAPKRGDTAAWESRTKKGMNLLLQHVSQGYNLMPPKGSCLTCSDADLTAAIAYLAPSPRTLNLDRKKIN